MRKGPVLVLATLFVILASCRQRIPGISMPEDKLVPLLMDVHLAEAALQNVHGTVKDSLTDVYLGQICTIHEVDREKLDRVLAELRNNPEAMDRVYRKVVQKIEDRHR